MKELQTAKKYDVTRAQWRPGTARCAGRSNQRHRLHHGPDAEAGHHDVSSKPRGAQRRTPGSGELVRQVRELSAERSEATNPRDCRRHRELFGHREEERRLEERLDALESELEDARGPGRSEGLGGAGRGAAAAPPRAPSARWSTCRRRPSTVDQAREARRRRGRRRSAAPPPEVPGSAFEPAKQAVLLLKRTGQVQWDRSAPPTSACPARLHGGELRAARRRARGGQGPPSQHALDIRRQEVTVEHLCDLTHAMLVAAGIDPVDVHMMWSKIGVRNRKIAKRIAGLLRRPYCTISHPGKYRPSGSPKRDARS